MGVVFPSDHIIITLTHMDDSCDTIHDGRAIPKLVAIATQMKL